MRPTLAPALLLIFALNLPAPAAAARAEPLQEFTESGGCKLRGSATSVARQKEIAAQGSVTWEGRCTGGYIDGPGILRHQGASLENGRRRRYAFFLVGVARAGQRNGAWRRESFNMFEDAKQYWTSLATINYVDGVAKGATRFIQVRSSADFTPSFRTFLAGIDRELAAAPGSPPPADAPATVRSAPTTGAATAPPAAAPAPAAPQPRREPAPPDSPVPGAAQATARAAEPQRAPLAAATPAPSPKPDELRLTPAPPKAPATTASANAATSYARGSALKLLAAPGTKLPAPAPPVAPDQQILEQRDACSVEQINGHVVGEESIVVSASQALRVTGWAADPNRPRAPEPPQIPERAWIRFYDRGGGPGLLVEMPRNADRPDVARALGHAGYARSGFRISVDPGRLRPGDYTVAIVQAFGADLAICSSIGRLSLK